MSGRRPSRGLRRQWRLAFVVMTTALLFALAGVTATYLLMAGRYRSVAHHLEGAISESSQLDAAVNAHELLSHQLWAGAPVDRAAYLREQHRISSLFAVALRDLSDSGEHALVVHAEQGWRFQLTSRGLWGPQAGPRPGG